MHELSQLPDQELLKAFQEGSGQAFEEIHNRYFKRLFVHAFKMLADEEAAQDIVQEVFINFWSKKESLQIQKSLAAYLYGSVRNRVLNAIEQRNVYQHHLDSLGRFLEEAGEESVDQAAEQEAFQRVFQTEIDNLPPKMREVFELRRNDELSYNEIADRLSISDKTVKKQINNAIKILKSRLIRWRSQFILIFF